MKANKKRKINPLNKPGAKKKSFEEKKSRFFISMKNKKIEKHGGLDKVKVIISKFIEDNLI